MKKEKIGFVLERDFMEMADLEGRESDEIFYEAKVIRKVKVITSVKEVK